MKNRILVSSALATGLVGVILAVTVGGAFAHSTAATPLPAATCSAIQNPSGNLLIASDLPLQGAGRAQTVQMTKAIAFVFAQAEWKAGQLHASPTRAATTRRRRPGSGTRAPARPTRRPTRRTRASSA